jgi:dephospho-CoA kinase
MSFSAVIVVSGRIASGKTTFAENLAEKLRLTRTGFGDEVKARARANGLPETREVLQEIGAELVESHAEEFCQAVLRRGNFVAGCGIVIDGIRHVEILDLLRRLVLPQPLFHIHIASPDELRKSRLQERDRRGEAALAVADSHSTEIQVGDKLPAIADLTLDGNQDVMVMVDESVAALLSRQA